MLKTEISLKEKHQGDPLKKCALGTLISIVHTGINKCISFQAILDNYNTSIAGLNSYYKVCKALNPKTNIPRPLSVNVDKNNVADVGKAIYHSYRNNNADTDNPYILEKTDTLAFCMMQQPISRKQ